MTRLNSLFKRSLLATALAYGLVACQSNAIRSNTVDAQPVVVAPVPALQIKNAQLQLQLLLLQDDVLQFSYTGVDATLSPDAQNSPMLDAKALQPYYQAVQLQSAQQDRVQALHNAQLTVAIDAESLCFAVYPNHAVDGLPWDKMVSLPTVSTMIQQVCPKEQSLKNLTVQTHAKLDDVMGLGQNFELFPNGNIESDHANIEDSSSLLNFDAGQNLSEFGNVMGKFFGGKAGFTQIPVAYYVTQDAPDVALFVDVPSKQRWTVSATTEIELPFAQQVNGFMMIGDNLAELRSQYLQITGHAPVPPKKMFGLWLSEYGFDNWQELDNKVDDLRQAGFPVEGAILDLQWYGGIQQRQMGRLSWDEQNFPQPQQKIADYRRDGLGLITIEQSYVDEKVADFAELEQQGFLVREEADGRSSFFASWWGEGGMLDWSDPQRAAQWHDMRRQPLIDSGIMGHWTDLGEPEDFDSNAWYVGAALPDHSHAQIHNLYNFLWSESLFDGYQRHHVAQRPFSLTRSGAAGSQRLGVAMWSGDVDSSLDSLMGHNQVQTNLSMSGIDYYGSDIGGFVRNGIDAESFNTLYTYWFANSCLFDVPIRPHVMNLSNQEESSPAKVGDVNSNLHNYLRRLQLTPYYYSLAHQAYQQGAALIAPMQYYYPDLPAAIARDFSASHKMIGPFLLSRTVYQFEGVDSLPSTEPLEDEPVGMYLPKGTWYDAVAQRFIQSEGAWHSDIGALQQQQVQLPLLYRAGAIVPVYSDKQIQRAMSVLRLGALDYLNNHADILQQPHLLLIADKTASQFTWYEDDGATQDYQQGQRLATTIHQQASEQQIDIQIDAAVGQLAFMPEQRNYQLTVKSAEAFSAKAVMVNGSAIAMLDAAAFAKAEQGALQQEEGWLVKTGLQSIDQKTHIQIVR